MFETFKKAIPIITSMVVHVLYTGMAHNNRYYNLYEKKLGQN